MASGEGKQYSLDALADALVSAHQWRGAAEPLRAYHEARRVAFARAFCLDDSEESLPSRKRYLNHLMRRTVESLAYRASPFSGYLEAPRDIVEFGERFGGAIDTAERELRRVLHTMLVALLEDLVSPRTFVTEHDLLENGFDPTTEAPDPADFW